MKDYASFEPEDFVADPEFLRWVKYPAQDIRLQEFWSNWLHEHPHKKEAMEEARIMILTVLREKQYTPEEGQQQDLWHRINETIGEERTDPFWNRWYAKVAAILIVGVTAFWFYNHHNDKPLALRKIRPGVEMEEQINNSNLPKTIVLSDGSSIVLQPHSVLEYPVTFPDDLREVFLKGEAFFEVKKDAARPFLVHAHEIVTRVLGTSFTVRSYDREKNVVVQVKTGTVSVFKQKAASTGTEETVEGVVLSPNQQVIYERRGMKMTKSLVENPSVLVPVAKQEFEFSDTPVREVFETIEQAYGVDIVYDEEAMASCYLNASLSDEPLYDKLKLICKGIHATYEIIDSHILIYGKGCETN